MGVDIDADALELSVGSQSSALSLTDEAVQLGDVVPVQRESRHRRLSSVVQRYDHRGGTAWIVELGLASGTVDWKNRPI